MELQVGSKEPLYQIMMARYYSSSLGRFMAADPGDDTDRQIPQSWNKYAYVRNNPLRSNDPSGQNLDDAIDYVGGILRGAVASATGGAYPGSGPQAGDSTASLTGQAIGSLAVGAVGALMAGAGGAEALVTAPAAATGVGAVIPAAGVGAAAAGGALVAGAGANLTKIANEAGSGNAGTTNEVVKRDSPGADGGSSQHIIEKDANGNTISVTHQATNGEGEVVHQHQTHIGKHGTQRQFPDAWVEHPIKDK